MPEVKVPEPLKGFVEAVNRGDLDAVLAYFGEDGTVRTGAGASPGRRRSRGGATRNSSAPRGI